MDILELYSGIGGMHMAFNETGINGKIVAAIEINPTANLVYKYNFPETNLLNKNIQGLTTNFINKLNINAILMSPPCQPFTRNGLKKDVDDTRTDSFTNLLQLLPDLNNIKYILMENVKGFETSLMRNKFIDILKKCNFNYQEFIISPSQIGVSNTRHRYYCLAKKLPLQFNFKTEKLMTNLPNNQETELFSISEIIENNIKNICTADSKRSCCFTKSYGKYVEGTGSVYSPKTQEEINEVYKQLKTITNEEQYLRIIKTLELRFFTPKEVASLMSFPEYFTFPNELTNNQKYKLLGNSINIKVVSKLIQILYN